MSSAKLRNAAGEEVVLSYHDSILRRSDVELLSRPCWLNDALIGFYWEYLGHQYGEPTLFIGPELTQLLKLTEPQEYPVFLEPLGALDRELILLPINDCSSRSAAGGSHWSLMVFSRPECTCYHLDSSQGMNEEVAREFSRKLTRYLLGDSVGQARFLEVKCPQQDNGYDCGLFVLCYADLVAQHFCKTGKVEGCDYTSAPTLVSGKRKSLLALIHQIKQT